MAKHDDLVLALAIAVWRAYGGGAGMALFNYYRELAREARDAMVVIRASTRVSHVWTRSDQSLAVRDDGTIEVTESDDMPLPGAG